VKDPRLYFTAFGEDPEDTQVQTLQADGTSLLWLDRAQGLSGIAFTRRGHLLGAQSLTHRIITYAVGKRGPRSVEFPSEQGILNQPNDVCEAPNGEIYITDPDFLYHTRSSVYLLRRNGELQQLITEMPLPNGLALSLDAKTLYVSDSHERLWRRYPLMANGVTAVGSILFDPETADRTPPNGMTIDSQGNLYLTGRGGVWVVDPEGVALGLIPVPGFCSSVTFGASDGKSLYITSDQKIYRLRMRVSGRGWASSGREEAKPPGMRVINLEGSDTLEGRSKTSE
jgi:gluconolactonase